MDDPLGVGLFDGVGEGRDDPFDLVEREGAAFIEQVGQRSTAQQLGHEESNRAR